jgi:hypothetical protein
MRVRAQTLATDPSDFANFETFSMAMVDLDYDGDVFRLNRVFWAEDLIKEAGGLETAARLQVRIPEQDFFREENDGDPVRSLWQREDAGIR